MNFDTSTISKFALGISTLSFYVSATSLFFSVINRWSEKRMQFEQLRGEIRSRLTFWGVEILRIMRKTSQVSLLPSIEFIAKVDKLLSGITFVRTDIQKLRYPAVVQLQAIMSDIKDAESVFERFVTEVNNVDWIEANKILDGLIERFYREN